VTGWILEVLAAKKGEAKKGWGTKDGVSKKPGSMNVGLNYCIRV